VSAESVEFAESAEFDKGALPPALDSPGVELGDRMSQQPGRMR
jgi:hypothetical protein